VQSKEPPSPARINRPRSKSPHASQTTKPTPRCHLHPHTHIKIWFYTAHAARPNSEPMATQLEQITKHWTPQARDGVCMFIHGMQAGGHLWDHDKSKQNSTILRTFQLALMIAAHRSNDPELARILRTTDRPHDAAWAVAHRLSQDDIIGTQYHPFTEPHIVGQCGDNWLNITGIGDLQMAATVTGDTVRRFSAACQTFAEMQTRRSYSRRAPKLTGTRHGPSCRATRHSAAHRPATPHRHQPGTNQRHRQAGKATTPQPDDHNNRTHGTRRSLPNRPVRQSQATCEPLRYGTRHNPTLFSTSPATPHGRN